MSVSMAIKCASLGLGLHHLQLVYQRGKEEGVKQVLMERFDNQSFLKQACAGANMSILHR